jgi:GNAT superfamily N-acetyltransferase
VRVTSAAPHHLRGELLEVVSAPTHKTRLPLLVGCADAVVELTEEPYDGPLGRRFLAALVQEVDCRYGGEDAGITPAEREAANAEYEAEVTPEMVARPAGVFLVAWLDGEAVGCGALRALHGVPGVGEVKRMYTDPSARRNGVSRTVLERLEAIAQELGYRRLQLETGTPQPEAIALYTSSGWHAIEPYGHYKDAPTSRCFAKDLPSP